jgi:hypothetical protein
MFHRPVAGNTSIHADLQGVPMERRMDTGFTR